MTSGKWKKEISSPLEVTWVNYNGAWLLQISVEEEAMLAVFHAQYADRVVASVCPVQVLVDPVERDAVRSPHSVIHKLRPLVLGCYIVTIQHQGRPVVNTHKY